ncbi:hypothetical protein DFQ28_000793 [Apophysomyces sp. BC1034]|nr:hypothetical protein DFQ30_000167 [Apophysomyces sp. BC1015]KAG0181380.1 hypothetical protein DFQ29_008518 [Apophysomyces sp. BC1021]KAG0191190.1 hypothetical protein DFQ28_000793 [Apophysomyces sp. BC1034]
MGRAAMNKKRQANAPIKRGPAKQPKVQEKHEATSQTAQEESEDNGGLFDNLDEEMDSSVLDQVMEQLEDNESEISEDETALSTASVNGDTVVSDAEEEEEKAEVQPEEEHKIVQAGKKQFRDHYMTQITQAFGTDLDKIRQEPNFNAVRLNVLIDSLEAGIDIFSDLEQEIILADTKARNE